jgi:Arc/MetJ-type ribon-helix-helix transcriptional regulator
MEVHLTPNQLALVRQAIESGRLHDERAAVKEALALWEDRELARAELIASLDEAEASIERGEGIVITQESMRQLAEDVKQRARARLAANHAAPR